MSNDKTGGPAFPGISRWMQEFADDGKVVGCYPTGANHGMTLRDYFAAKAMAAIIGCYRDTMRGVDNSQTEAESDMQRFARESAIDPNGVTGDMDGATEIANDAYTFADAMLKARESK